MKTKKIFKWIKEHLRLHFGYNSLGEKINWKQDEFEDIVDEIKNKSEVGFKIKFKF